MEKTSYAMPLDTLQAMLTDGTFHHATYRNIGTLWEGLHIYCKSATGFLGYDHAGVFPKNDPELDKAFELCRGTGISVGSYGRGTWALWRAYKHGTG